MKFKNHFNADQFPDKGEVNDQPSKTIPDQTMSIREIVARFQRGLPIDAGKVPIYHGEDIELPDIRKLDLVEIQEMKQQIGEDITNLENQYNELKKPKPTKKPAKTQQDTTETTDTAEDFTTVEPV